MPYCFGIKNIELAVAQLVLYDEVGPFYIYPLREGSDDCWESFEYEGVCYWGSMQVPRARTRPCAVWTGTSDHDVLACFGTTGSPRPGE